MQVYVIATAKYKDGEDIRMETMKFKGLYKIRHPTGMVACPDNTVLFILDEDTTLFADKVCRVQIATGRIDKTWTVDQDACSLSLTAQGHLTLSWWDHITEYSTSGQQLISHTIPSERNMDVVETIPMPYGESRTMKTRYINTRLFEIRNK